MHFNFNLQREEKKKDDGAEQVKVSYPKFKNGEATVHNTRIMQNFGEQHFYFSEYDLKIIILLFKINTCLQIMWKKFSRPI